MINIDTSQPSRFLFTNMVIVNAVIGQFSRLKVVLSKFIGVVYACAREEGELLKEPCFLLTLGS